MINGNRRYETEVRMEAAGLIREVSETSFKFIAHMVYKILQLLDAPNKLMQSEDMDLLSAVKLVTCASECLTKLRSESDFLELWEKADDTEMPRPSKRKRTINKGLWRISAGGKHWPGSRWFGKSRRAQTIILQYFGRSACRNLGAFRRKK